MFPKYHSSAVIVLKYPLPALSVIKLEPPDPPVTIVLPSMVTTPAELLAMVVSEA